MADLYAVLEFNQASGQPEDQAYLYWSVADAKQAAEDMTRGNRSIGRREGYRVFELTEVDDAD